MKKTDIDTYEAYEADGKDGMYYYCCIYFNCCPRNSKLEVITNDVIE